MPPPRFDEIVPPLTRRLAAAGLDLWSWTPLDRYNAAVPPEYALPSPGDPGAPCLVIGNSRALWPFVLGHAAAHPDDPDPVDGYVARVVTAALADVPVSAAVRFAPEPPPRRVALQRLAHLAGLAHLGPAHLTVHATHGPWHGLRAAVALAVTPPAGPPPGPAPDPCTGCEKPCLEALDAALAGGGPRESWRAWARIRDVCPAGTTSRYGENQRRYHYTGSRRWLRADPRGEGPFPPA